MNSAMKDANDDQEMVRKKLNVKNCLKNPGIWESLVALLKHLSDENYVCVRAVFTACCSDGAESINFSTRGREGVRRSSWKGVLLDVHQWNHPWHSPAYSVHHHWSCACPVAASQCPV